MSPWWVCAACPHPRPRSAAPWTPGPPHPRPCAPACIWVGVGGCSTRRRDGLLAGLCEDLTSSLVCSWFCPSGGSRGHVQCGGRRPEEGRLRGLGRASPATLPRVSTCVPGPRPPSPLGGPHLTGLRAIRVLAHKALKSRSVTDPLLLAGRSALLSPAPCAQASWGRAGVSAMVSVLGASPAHAARLWAEPAPAVSGHLLPPSQPW